MSKVYLETNRMIFKKIKETDAEFFYDLDSDPEVVTYISGGKPSTYEFCLGAVDRVLSQYKKYDDKFGMWWVESKESGELLGWFLLRPNKLKPDTIENPELGYRFKKQHWGKGYATEGSLALRDKAFLDLACDSVYAVAIEGNQASQNVMKKIGMRFLGCYKQAECSGPGDDKSAVHYKITKEEWLNEQN